MNSETFNKEHAASIDYVNQAVAGAWDKMKVWMEENVDKSNIVTIAKEYLDRANRQVIGDTITEKAQAISTSIDAIVKAMTDCGVDMEGITSAQIAQYITTIADNAGVWIEDADGVLWTAASWAYEKQQRGGVDPAVFQGIVLTNNEHEFYIASRNYGPMQFGAHNHTIPNLEGLSGGPSGTPVDGEHNGRKILAATDPDKLRPFGWAIDYYEGLNRLALQDIDVVFFPDQATLTAWATNLGVSEMLAIGQSKIYAIPHTDGVSWVLKYFSGNSSITFGNREAVAPYTDNNGQIGCTAADACVRHREYEGDDFFWRNPSLFELLMMMMNKNDINACRSAIGQVALPHGFVWSCISSNDTYEFYFNLAEWSWNYSNKGLTCNVVPVASRKR